MSPDKLATGYPPVTETEERRAAETAPEPSGRFGGRSARLSANERIVADAIAAVIDRYRAEIEVAPLSAEARRHALDLLDAVLLDILQIVLNEASALEVLRDKRGVRH